MKSFARQSSPASFLRQLSLFVLLLLSVQVAAQRDSSDFRPHLLIGGQYGMSWNRVRFSPILDQEPLPGARYSLAGRYVEAPNLGVLVELSYDQRGWAELRDTLPSTYKQKIDYLELSFY
ncbi:MAG: hypothetical protein D6772_15335, partial [Bacteroidetes bacterium]